MRPIEFRGKSINQNMWLYGHLFQWGLTKGVLCVCCCVPNSYRDVYNIYAVNPETIGQYTGLKDKNGTKIFEGDIVKHRGYNGMQTSVVKFEAGAFIVGYHDGSSTKRRPMLLQDKVEVIGNIHEIKE